MNCSSRLIRSNKTFVMAAAMLAVFASLVIHDRATGIGCYRLHPTAECGGDSNSGTLLECYGCSTATCPQCSGWTFIIQHGVINICENAVTNGYTQCQDAAGLIFMRKINYTCNETTHCYEMGSSADYGQGCYSALLGGAECNPDS